MRALTELMVRLTDLAEAEGRLLRSSAMRLALGVSTLALAAVVAGGGLLFLLGSAYIVTSFLWGRSAGAAVTGGIALLAAGALSWLAHRLAA